MIKAIIIDDISDARHNLAEDIKRYCPGIEVIAEADGVATGLEVIKKHKPGLVFLDIQLEDGTGFNILEALGKHDFKVIFTTANDGYALKAIKYSALDYLLKPVDPEELVAAIQKMEEQKSPGNESLRLLAENLRNLSMGPKRIALNSAERVQIVPVADIIRCESQRNYTLFFLVGNKQILVTKTLKEFDEMLAGNDFIRIHHSHLINMNFLREFVKTDGGHALMSDGSKVPVAVRKKDEFLKRLGV